MSSYRSSNFAAFICVGGPKDGETVRVDMGYQPPEKKSMDISTVSDTYQMTEDYQGGYRVLKYMATSTFKAVEHDH